MSTLKDRISKAISLANGRRRIRLLDFGDVMRVIGEAIVDGSARTGGGYVANAYFKKCFHSVSQTTCYAALENKIIKLRIGTCSASKGSSLIPRIGCTDTTTIDIDLGTARRMVNKWRKDRGELITLPKVLKNIIVTKDDSLMVGNCEAYTNKIIDEIGKESGTSDELFSFVKLKYPDQLVRAVRAIKYAASKVKPVGV